MGAFEILNHDAGSRARAGVLHLTHGSVRTPAFVPLATRGAVKTLTAADVVALGYEMVLGNTYHLWLEPGADLIAELGGLHDFMGWQAPIITDSGGFQVFSMGHGAVADEIKGRGRGERDGAILAITEDGVRFRSYVDGGERVMRPETSMEIQAALGSDIALVFDECTPFHISREYTQASTERTHRWLERCLSWHAEHGPEGQLVYGIVQGGVHEDLRRESARVVAGSGAGGIAIGGSLGQDKAQMYEVVGWATSELPDELPRHLLGIGEIDDLVRCVALGIDTFDCAMPTRLGRHGMALVPEPANRWRVDLGQSRWTRSAEPVLAGCGCPTCTAGHTRGYLRHLLKTGETTGQRLLTLHNLAFVAAVIDDLRTGIADGRLTEVGDALLGGAMPAALSAGAARG